MIDNSVVSAMQKIATLVAKKAARKEEEFASKYITITSRKESNQLLKLEHIKAKEKVAFFRNEIASVKASKFVNEYNQNPSRFKNFDDILRCFREIASDKAVLPIVFKLEHWINTKKQADLRINPPSSFSPKELSIPSITSSMKSQLRYIHADESQMPIIQEYLIQPNSNEGNQIRAFAARIKKEGNKDMFSQIPAFIEEQRKSLINTIKGWHVTKKNKETDDSISPFDALRHTEIGAATLLSALVGAKDKLTAEFIELAMEKYFYSLCGHCIFEKIKNNEVDQSIEGKCIFLSKLSLTQFNMDASLAKYGTSLFKKTIILIKDIATRTNPTSKLITLYRAIEALLQEIFDKTGMRPGVDDFTDPLQYCCVQANIPNLKTQVDFINLLVKPKVMQSAFGAHFITFNLVVSNLIDLNIGDALMNEINDNANIAQMISVAKNAPTPSKFSVDDDFISSIPLVLGGFPDNVPGVNFIGEAVPIHGYKSYVIPSLLFSFSALTHAIVVPSGNQEDVVLMYPVVTKEDQQGQRVNDLVLYPPNIRTKLVPCEEGIIVTLDNPSDDIKQEMIPIQTADIENSYEEYSIIAQYMQIDGLPGSLSLEEHHTGTEKIYGVHCDNDKELIAMVVKPLIESLVTLGFMKKQEPIVNIHLINAIKRYKECFPNSKQTDGKLLSFELYKQIIGTVELWKKAFMTKSFGLSPDVDWRVGVSIIQFINGIPITGILDQKTMKLSRKTFAISKEIDELTEDDINVINTVL